MISDAQPTVLLAAHTLCRAPFHWRNAEGERNCANLWFIADGHGTWQGEGRIYPCTPGDFFVQRLWKSCEGRNPDGPPLDVMWANIGWRDRRGIKLDLRLYDRELPVVHRRVSDLGFMAALFQRMIAASVRGAHAEADRWLACILNEADRASDDHGDALIASIVDAIRCEPEKSWRVSGLARSVKLPVDAFARRFRAAIGVSPRTFLVRARLDSAKALLRMSDACIGDIAARLGFCDIYHFSRRFRNHVGCAPTAYRRGTNDANRP